MAWLVSHAAWLVGTRIPEALDNVLPARIPPPPPPPPKRLYLLDLPPDMLRLIISLCVVDPKTRCLLRRVCKLLHRMIIQSWIPLGVPDQIDVPGTCLMCDKAPATPAHRSSVYVVYYEHDRSKSPDAQILERKKTDPISPTYTMICSRKCMEDLCVGACIAWCDGNSSRIFLLKSIHCAHNYALTLYYTPQPMFNLIPERVIKRIRIN
jgi:hypothetical protein